MMSDDSSELSSVPSDDESDLLLTKKDGILKFFSKVPGPAPTPKVEASPPPPERSPSPAHEYVLADNTEIAFIVMFRSRFTEAFPKSLANFGPQELERGVADSLPGEHVEQFLCALLGLLLNRKQDVKAGHYNRALEEAVQTHKAQWAKDWESKNPLSGGATFSTMNPAQRLTLLRTLILWSLSSSEIVRGIITSSYKQNRHEDDLNQPLSVQPWGSDGHRRRYFLIEGLDDTAFRVYRESNPAGIKRTWWSVAGDIDQLRELAEKLATKDGGQKARLLSGKILQAIPRFEATEEKRKRREYRQIRKQQFKRPEPNYSLYEGRTRGKRMKYTYSDDEDEGYSDATSRRSTRHTGSHTPAEPAGPTVTLSGRQVRSRHGGVYGETMLSGAQTPAVAAGTYDETGDQPDADDDDESIGRRPRRAAATIYNPTGRQPKVGRHIQGYNSVDEMDDEEDDASEQDYGDDEDDDQVSLESDGDDRDDMSEEDLDVEDDFMDEADDKKSLVVRLPVKTPTPEKKSNPDLDLSSEKKVSNLVQPSAESMQNTGGTENGNKSITTSVMSPSVPLPVSQPLASIFAVKNATQPIAMSPKAQSSQAGSSPLSPSLAYRGSPGKAHAFPQVINVGQGGS